MRNRTYSLLKLFAVVTFVIGMSVAGSAQGGSPVPSTTNGRRTVPELNPATGAAALALLTGAVLVIRGRKR